MKLDDLLARWVGQAALLDELGAAGQAATFRRCAKELEEAMHQHLDEPIPLPQAAKESGYSVDHVARLLKEGKVRNAGKKHRPLVRRRDLPRKPGHAPEGPEIGDILRIMPRAGEAPRRGA